MITLEAIVGMEESGAWFVGKYWNLKPKNNRPIAKALSVPWTVESELKYDKFTALHQYFLPGERKKLKKLVGHKIQIILNSL